MIRVYPSNEVGSPLQKNVHEVEVTRNGNGGWCRQRTRQLGRSASKTPACPLWRHLQLRLLLAVLKMDGAQKRRLAKRRYCLPHFVLLSSQMTVVLVSMEPLTFFQCPSTKDLRSLSSSPIPFFYTGLMATPRLSGPSFTSYETLLILPFAACTCTAVVDECSVIIRDPGSRGRGTGSFAY